MWIEVVIFIIIVLWLVSWINHHFSVAGQIERLWKRIHKIDYEVDKIFVQNPNFDTDNLAFDDSDNNGLYYKIWKLNKEIDTTGKLIDAMLDYYFSYEYEGYADANRYQFKSGEKVIKDNFNKLYVEQKKGFLSVQRALKIREEDIERKNKDEELKRKKETYKEIYGEEMEGEELEELKKEIYGNF